MTTSLRRLLRRRWLWISVAAIAAYAAAGFWLVPRVLASAARDTVSKRYHRSLQLGLVTFNPFTLELERAPWQPKAVASARVRGVPATGVSAVAQPEIAPESPGALPIELGLVRVEDGSLNFSDLSIKPNFTTGVQRIAGTIKGLSARQDARADVDLAGQVARYTPVRITGKVNYFAAQQYTNLRLAFKNLELTGLLDGTGIDPSRVFVITAPPLSAARGPLRMQLSLQ